MRGASAWSLTLSGLLLCAPAPAVYGQAAAIPLSLGVTASPTEINAGGTVKAVVRLKNYQGDTVAASEPVTVTLHSELSGDDTVTFSVGQSTANADVGFQSVGVATLVATAPKMTSGSAVVVVKAESAANPAPLSKPSPPASPSGGGPTAAPAAVTATRAGAPAPKRNRPLPGSAPATTSSGTADPNLRLEVDMLPQHVHPLNSAWRALVLVTAINEARQPIAVQSDTDVHLATDAGLVTPALARIEAGKARTTETIQLTSDRPGNGTVWAWTDTGQLTTAAVEYHDAVPTRLLVRGLPSRAVNDGRTAVNVTVFLQDETASAASAEQDVAVKLISSVGAPNPSDLSIPKGKFFGEAVLTSPVSGTAEITATAPRFKPGSAQVEFVFPFFLVTLAATGGLIGSVVRTGRQIFTGVWWWHLAASVGMGIVLGLVFYALALFGIIASIPKVAIPLAQLPTTNDLGALVLGFLGGYYARAWLPEPGGA